MPKKKTTKQKQIEELKKIAEEYKQLLQRTQADFQNYMKRVEKEKTEEKEKAQAEIIKQILPIIDSLEQAVQQKKELEPVLNQAKQILRKIGVAEIENKEFDPSKHEALMTAKEKDKKENEILEVFQKGYMFKDKIIRTSKVKVNLK